MMQIPDGFKQLNPADFEENPFPKGSKILRDGEWQVIPVDDPVWINYGDLIIAPLSP